MVLTAARMLVAPPARTLLPYGLMSVAQMPPESDVYWQNGVRFEPDTCSQANVTTTDCPAPPVDKIPTDPMGLRGSNPFTVYTMPICSPVGYIDEARTRAIAALTSGEARTVEQEFWTGAFGTTPHLAASVGITGSDGVVEQSAASVVATGGPMDVVEGIALIDEALSTCYGNEGVIHVPRSVLTHMQAWGLVIQDGSRLRTRSGHLVAAGAGYTGSSPTAPTGGPGVGLRWVYATGAVSIRRTEVQVPESRPGGILNRVKNDVVLVAERTYVIGWDCCHFAIPINITGVTSGTLGA